MIWSHLTCLVHECKKYFCILKWQRNAVKERFLIICFICQQFFQDLLPFAIRLPIDICIRIHFFNILQFGRPRTLLLVCISTRKTVIDMWRISYRLWVIVRASKIFTVHCSLYSYWCHNVVMEQSIRMTSVERLLFGVMPWPQFGNHASIDPVVHSAEIVLVNRVKPFHSSDNHAIDVTCIEREWI